MNSALQLNCLLFEGSRRLDHSLPSLKPVQPLSLFALHDKRKAAKKKKIVLSCVPAIKVKGNVYG